MKSTDHDPRALECAPDKEPYTYGTCLQDIADQDLNAGDRVGMYRVLAALWARIEGPLSGKDYRYDIFAVSRYGDEFQAMREMRKHLSYIAAEQVRGGRDQVNLRLVAERDLVEIRKKDAEYGGSWLRRGGTGAFMMMARKWDRIVQQVGRHGGDLWLAIQYDTRDEGLLDDIGDLRRYMYLIDAETLARASNSSSGEKNAPF